MFARTSRLILRPAWPEDAPHLARAIGEDAIARNLVRATLPNSEADARAWISQSSDNRLPELLVFLRTRGTPRLVGGCGISLDAHGSPELGYWVDRRHWGLGFATEAARAVLGMARAAGLGMVRAAHFIDNPASGKVLRKLGFRPVGEVERRWSRARASDVPAMLYEQAEPALQSALPVYHELYADALMPG
jgi:RimJ/RimL family protein N-acetyltransferase